MLGTTLAALDLPAVLAGRFRVSGVVGCGGIAKVVRATDDTTGAEVALKVMFPNLRANVELVARFRREVAVVTRVDHPNVVPILGLFEDQGHLFLAMPLMAGDLQQWLGEHGPMPLDPLARLAVDLCGAIEAAHAAGVIHRDIKPLNILRAQQAHGEALSFSLSDFGLARTMDLAGVTTANTLLGTPEYMAPEVASDGFADPRSDVYSLAVVLFEAATGRLPYVADTPFQMLHQHLTAEPPSPKALRSDLPAAFAAALLRGLSKDPTERFSGAAAFGAAIARSFDEGAQGNDPEPLAALVSSEHAQCSACGHVFVREIAVCTRCGNPGLAASVGKGSCSVIIWAPADGLRRLDTARHARLLKALEGVVVDREILYRLRGKPPTLPILVAHRIDRASAELLVQAVREAGMTADIVGWWCAVTEQHRSGEGARYALAALAVSMTVFNGAARISPALDLMSGGIAQLLGVLAGSSLLGLAFLWAPRPKARFRRRAAVASPLHALAKCIAPLDRSSDKRIVGRATELTWLLCKHGDPAWAEGIVERLMPSINALVALDESERALAEQTDDDVRAQERLREAERLRLLALSDLLGVLARLESITARLLAANDQQNAIGSLLAEVPQRLQAASVQNEAVLEVKALLKARR